MTKPFRICVSDADILVKFCKAGFLSLLGQLFNQVIVPKKVFEEAELKIGLQARGLSLHAAQQEGWLKSIDISNPQNDLTREQKHSILSYIETYRYSLDPGELEASAIAHELGIQILLTDDRTAKRLIQEWSELICIAHWEILWLCINVNLLKMSEAEKIFQALQTVVEYPVKIPFKELMKRSSNRLNYLLETASTLSFSSQSKPKIAKKK
ncbi:MULTISPECIES: hypothetical protein [unclassified Neomoorella]|uniref:hypothetical protein n=1 Tax=unclassified Neomoorella TaxID=2676739 RepID=UPI0011444A35|nr:MULTISPECIES: hypothetical protein [unclassified Moorella (in: firmicutes)]